MRRRFRPTNAYVDESIRGQRYLMTCALVQAHELAPTRQIVSDLAGGRNRIHFNRELDAQRRMLLLTFATLPIEAFTVSCQRDHGVTEFEARGKCLEAIVDLLQERQVERLVIESRQDDTDDERIIRRRRRPQPRLVFEHVRSADEPLLWIADGVAWTVGAGQQWQRLLGERLRQMIDL